MNSYHLFFLSICLLLFSCNNQERSANIEVSDTVKVLQAALLRGTDDRYMSSLDQLFKNWQNRDTAYFTTRALPLELLPNYVRGIKLKKISPDSLCSILKNLDAESIRNYLSLEKFEKSDTGYYAQIGSLSCEEFGGGGMIGIYLKKQADSFIVLSSHSSSIN